MLLYFSTHKHKDSVCTDKEEKCSVWAKSETKEGQGYCESYTFVKKNCKKSCDLCSGEYLTVRLHLLNSFSANPNSIKISFLVTVELHVQK